jgi:hypothetical protein
MQEAWKGHPHLKFPFNYPIEAQAGTRKKKKMMMMMMNILVLAYP